MPISPSTLRVPRSSPWASARRRMRRRAAVCSVASAVAVATGIGMASPAQAASRAYLGAVGDISGLSQSTGAPLAVHMYSYFSRNVPKNSDMITVRAPGYTWRQVAAAAPGQALYNDIVRWAQTIKGLGRNVMLAYHHEPEASKSNSYGTAPDFIAAYRHVESIFKAQGATNVVWVWQMTDYAFRVSSSDRRYAAKWYPGDSYVDNVGADGYNWYTCYGRNTSWHSMSDFAGPVVSFARAHGKTTSFPEFGSVPGTRRTQWLQDAHSYLAANPDITGVFYFQVDSGGSSCTWKLNTSAEYSAFRSMATDSAHFQS